MNDHFLRYWHALWDRVVPPTVDLSHRIKRWESIHSSRFEIAMERIQTSPILRKPSRAPHQIHALFKAVWACFSVDHWSRRRESDSLIKVSGNIGDFCVHNLQTQSRIGIEVCPTVAFLSRKTKPHNKRDLWLQRPLEQSTTPVASYLQSEDFSSFSLSEKLTWNK